MGGGNCRRREAKWVALCNCCCNLLSVRLRAGLPGGRPVCRRFVAVVVFLVVTVLVAVRVVAARVVAVIVVAMRMAVMMTNMMAMNVAVTMMTM